MGRLTRRRSELCLGDMVLAQAEISATHLLKNRTSTKLLLFWSHSHSPQKSQQHSLWDSSWNFLSFLMKFTGTWRLTSHMILTCFVNNPSPIFLSKEDISTAITTKFMFLVTWWHCLTHSSGLLHCSYFFLECYEKAFYYLLNLSLRLVHSNYVLWQCYYNIINQNNNNNNAVMAFPCSESN